MKSAIIAITLCLTAVRTFCAQADYVYKGLPRYSGAHGPLLVLTNIGYVVGYSEFYEVPLWSAYHIKWVPNATSPPRPKRFITDDRTIHPLTHDDYTQSNYFTNPKALDRGHMTPNFAIGSRFGAEAQRETFFMSNICPQRAPLNQQTWKYLEHLVASDYSRDFQDLWVVVGPIFNKKDHPSRLNGKAAIPDSFYMLILDEAPSGGTINPRVLAVVMTQKVSGPQELRKYVKTVAYVQQKTALDFFPDLDDNVEQAIESSLPDETWELHRILTE